MTDERRQWSNAFMRQADSDLAVYDVLAARSENEVPRCHSLHYLQMACEKVAKAYRIRDTKAALHGEGGLLSRHVGFEKFLSALLGSPTVRARYEGRREQLREVKKRLLPLAREIEKLAPAVDSLTSPHNAEYPWSAGTRIVAPSDHDFSRLSLLDEPGGRQLLKLIRQAIRDFETISLP